MTGSSHHDIRDIEEQLAAAEGDARVLVAGMTEQLGTSAPVPGAWSVAQCLDHLATANRVYLAAMRGAAERARARGRLRRGPAKPGFLGGLFARSLEPPPRKSTTRKAPRTIKPRESPPLSDSIAAFFTSQDEVRAFLRESADLDLSHILFPNPFVHLIRWSLATGFHVITAHERRHLWQAWQARRKLEGEALPAS